MEKENSMDLITEFEFELPRGYLTIILLSRVITSLGTLTNIRPTHIEKLFSADLAFLQNMYQTINSMEDLTETCVCPHCGEKFEKPVNFTRAE